MIGGCWEGNQRGEVVFQGIFNHLTHLMSMFRISRRVEYLVYLEDSNVWSVYWNDSLIFGD